MNEDDKEEVETFLEILERLATLEPPAQKRIVDRLPQHVREDKLSDELDSLKARLGKLPGSSK